MTEAERKKLEKFRAVLYSDESTWGDITSAVEAFYDISNPTPTMSEADCEQAEEQIKKAFIDGFNMSGEGFNAEYGCDVAEVVAMADRYTVDVDNGVCDCEQEPVAWMCEDGLCISAKAKAYHGDDTPEYSTPLYTHQANVHGLSEDEKYKFIDDHVRILSTGDALDLVNRVIDACNIPKDGE